MIRTIFDYYTRYGHRKVDLVHTEDKTVTKLAVDYDGDFGLFSVAYIQDGKLNTKIKSTAQVFQALNNKVWIQKE